MRLSVLLLGLFLAGCALTRPAEPLEPPPEAVRLIAVLDALQFSPIPSGLAEGDPLWNDLNWTTRKAVEAAQIRRHFLVRGDEVDVLIYPNARIARHEGERVWQGVGLLPLADTPGGAEGEISLRPVAYFVAGPVVVRQRGLDDTLRVALTAALGEPITGGGPRSPIALAPPAPDLSYDPYDVGPFGTPLYQGSEVPSWSVDPAAVSRPFGAGAAYRALYYGQ